MTWLAGNDPSRIRNAEAFSPGGEQPYEHRWSVGEAFRFHMAIGKSASRHAFTRSRAR